MRKNTQKKLLLTLIVLKAEDFVNKLEIFAILPFLRIFADYTFAFLRTCKTKLSKK